MNLQLKNITTAFKAFNFFDMMRMTKDWQKFIRWHFLYTAMESGLIDLLKKPASKDEIIQKLDIKRPDLLEPLLDVGCSLGELSCKKGLYRVRGKRTRMLSGKSSEMFQAFLRVGVTYYNSVYEHAPSRFKGAPNGNYLEYIGPMVAAFAKVFEPFNRNFINGLVAGKGPKNILDVGCGSGLNIKLAAEANPWLSGIGIDIDRSVAEQARQNLAHWGLKENFSITSGDIRNFSKDFEGKFDFITLYNIIYYFPNNERAELFRSLRGMLAPGGSLAIVNSVAGYGSSFGTANLDMALRSIKGCYPLPELKDLAAQLKESGFQAVTSTKFLPGDSVYGITAR
ncbi:MAG: methyltransferase domain-containing protein [bacterium]|nr:methyltransferase domain-containing protein [bacterium]